MVKKKVTTNVLLGFIAFLLTPLIIMITDTANAQNTFYTSDSKGDTVNNLDIIGQIDFLRLLSDLNLNGNNIVNAGDVYANNFFGNISFNATQSNVNDSQYLRGEYPISDIAIANMDWDKLFDYPSGCGPSQAVQVIGDTLICIDLTIDTNASTACSGNEVLLGNGTCLSISDIPFNVSNITFDFTNIAYRNESNIFTEYNSFLNGFNATISWGNLTDYPTACLSNETITGLGDIITCSPISILTSQIIDFATTTFPFDKTNIAYRNESNTFTQYNSFTDGFNASINCTNITGSISNLCNITDTSLWRDNGTFLEPKNTSSKRVYIPQQLRIGNQLFGTELNLGYDDVGLYMNTTSTNGFLWYMKNANFPQIILGASNMTGAAFIDSQNGKPINLNTLASDRMVNIGSNLSVGTNLTVGNFATIGTGGTPVTNLKVYTPTINIASVSASSTSEQTFTVTGLSVTDTIYGNKPSETSGCIIGNLRVSATNTLAITIGNVNLISSCDPPSETWRIVAIRSVP